MESVPFKRAYYLNKNHLVVVPVDQAGQKIELRAELRSSKPNCRHLELHQTLFTAKFDFGRPGGKYHIVIVRLSIASLQSPLFRADETA